MAKRIIGLVLALCLIVGLLPMIALAEETTKPSINFYYQIVGSSMQTTLAPGGATKYFVTQLNAGDNLYYSKAGTADNWNIKLEYPADGIPTLTLKDATITSEITFALRADTSNNLFNGDVKIILEGENYLSRNNPYNSDVDLKITGTAYIEGDGKLKISHKINSSAAALIRSTGGLVLDNVDIDLELPAGYSTSGNGIAVDNGNLTIKGGDLKITGVCLYDADETLPDGVSGKWYSWRPLKNAIKVTGTDAGNLIIQDGANVQVIGSATTSGGMEFPLVNVAGSVTVKNSDVELGAVKGTYEHVLGTATAPAFNMEFAGGYTVYTGGKGTYDLTTNTFTAPAEDKLTTYTNIADATLTKLSYFKIVHGCYSASDDKDCTTANTCDVCGTSLGTAQTAHTAAADDGDCTTPIKCTNAGCEQIVTAGAAAHTPAADDNDCSTDTVCTVCGKVTTPAPGHTPADRDSCDVAANCTVCGKEALKAGDHTGGTATCKEKAKCTECGKEYGELADHTGGTATCKDKAICTVCNQAYGELSTVHTPEADDKDCTTAVKCSVCGGEAIAAKTHAFTNGLDTTCDNEGCEHTRVVEPKPVFSVSFDTSSAKDGSIPSSAGYATVKMNAGDAAKYYVTSNHDVNAPAKFYTKELTDATKIAAGEWNIKIEYDPDGIPTFTLKNAKIVSKYGILFGGWNAANEGPVKVVLEGENIIAAEYSYKSALQFLFKGDKGGATIEGPGKLLVSTNCHGGSDSKMAAVNVMKAGLTMNNANLTVLTSEEWGNSFGIVVDGGDFTVNGGSLKVVGYDDSKTTHYEGKDTGYNLNANAMYAGVAIYKTDENATNGNFTVEGGAKVMIATSIAKNSTNPNHEAVLTQGKFTIKDSEVEIALIGKCVDGSKLFMTKPTLEFKDGAYTVTATKTKKPVPTLVDYEYDQYTKEVTALAPDESKLVNWAETTSLGSITYFKVVAGGTGAGTGGNTGSGTGTGTGTGTGSNPNTGDVSILLTAAIALSSAVGFAGVTVLRKKEN